MQLHPIPFVLTAHVTPHNTHARTHDTHGTNTTQVEHALFVNQRKNVLKLLSSLTVVVRETKEQEVIEPSDGAQAATAVVPFRPVRQNLGEVQFFVGASKAMRGLPLPPATLDPFISASLSAVLHKNLLLKRFGWRELTAWDWWGHIRNNLHLLTAPGISFFFI